MLVVTTKDGILNMKTLEVVVYASTGPQSSVQYTELPTPEYTCHERFRSCNASIHNILYYSRFVYSLRGAETKCQVNWRVLHCRKKSFAVTSEITRA